VGGQRKAKEEKRPEGVSNVNEPKISQKESKKGRKSSEGGTARGERRVRLMRVGSMVCRTMGDKKAPGWAEGKPARLSCLSTTEEKRKVQREGGGVSGSEGE